MAQIAFEANLVAPAELKFAQSGKAVAKARLAENHRGKNPQSGDWEDTGTTWHNVTAFGALAEKLAEVPKGSRLTVQGRQSSRAYEKDGDTRQWTETIADVFGVVPKAQQSSPRPSPQGEQWNNAQQCGSGTGGGAQWPAAAQPGSGQPWDQSRAQQGFDQPPF